MRLVFALFILLSACGAKRSSGPAWPKMTEKESDGGESIAPRPGASAVAAVEASADAKSDDDKPADTKPAEKTDDEDGDEDASEAAASPDLDRELIITTDEIVIEIEDDE